MQAKRARTGAAEPRLVLRKELARRLRAGHPWVYAEALDARPDLPAGSVVELAERDGAFLARGLYDPRSPIAVRVATLDPAERLDERFVRARVARALRAREGLVDRAATDALRLLNGEGDLLPGVVADLYAGTAVLRLDGEAARAWRDWTAAALAVEGREAGVERVVERRPGGGLELLQGDAPTSPALVRESGVAYAVDLARGHKTGLFLDQRENRLAVRRFARGARVADLFAYAGGFALHAAIAGAESVTLVESARPALAAARENLARNGIDPARHELVCGDARDWLDVAAREGRRFDLVVLDPPSLAPSRERLGQALESYRELNARALACLAPEGVLASASCSSHVRAEAFLEALADAAARAGRPLRLLELHGQPGDHPSLPAHPEGRYLKLAIARAAP